MEFLFNAIKTDEQMARDFAAAMHEIDPEIISRMGELYKEIDKLARKAITDFAKEKNLELSEDELNKRTKDICRNVKTQVEHVFPEQFNNILINFGKPTEAPVCDW